MDLNTGIFAWLQGLAAQSALLSFLGSIFGYYLPYIMGVGILFFILRKKGSRDRTLALLQIVFIAVLSRYILFPIADLIAGHGGFPSASAAFFFAVSFAFWAFRRKWGILFVVLSFLNAIGLIMVGADYPADIVGGLVIAAVSFLVFRALFLKKDEIVPEAA